MKNLTSTLISCASFLLVVFFSLMVTASSGQEVGTFKDKRDGQMYSFMKIGKQTWMIENLKFIPSSGAWAYNDSSEYVRSYGYLYDWNAAQTACPKGWRVPSSDEFGILFESLGGESEAGLRCMEMDTIYWKRMDSLPENPAGKATLLGGTRRGDGTFTGIGLWGGLWSSSLDAETFPIDFLFARGDSSISRSSHNKSSAFFVRCIRK